MAGKRIKKMDSRNVGTNFYRYDQELGFWGAPDVERDLASHVRPDVPIRCRHNSQGNRDEDVVIENIRNPIVCIGGSHTWGAGVEYGQRYSEILKKLTGRTVLNLGHCSLGLDQICLAIIKKAAYYNPYGIVVEQHPWAIHRVLSHYVNGYMRPYFFLDVKGSLKLKKISVLARFKLCRRIIGAYHDYQKEFSEFKAKTHKRKGSTNEWKQVLSKDQVQNIDELIPEEWFERFNWARI